MRSAWYFIAVFIAASAQAQEPHQAADGLEIGARYWLSSGSTTRSHDASSADPSLLNPTSTLLYDQLDANIIELLARKRIGEKWFAKGSVGLGKINSGTFTDEDFFLIGGEPFHTMTLSATGGNLGYATIDIGRELVRTAQTVFGMYVGYQYWNEKVDGQGFSDAFGPAGLPPEVLAITNEITWQMLRLGGEVRLTNGRTRFIVDAAWVPYATYRNEDSHYLRVATLGPVPNVIATGHGRGGTFDAEVRRSYPQLGGIDIGVGVRYWKLNAYNGSQTAAGFTFPIVDLESERYGFTFTVAKSW